MDRANFKSYPRHEGREAVSVVHIPFRREHLGEMADRLKEVVYSYSDRISLAEAIGCIEIVKVEILTEAKGEPR